MRTGGSRPELDGRGRGRTNHGRRVGVGVGKRCAAKKGWMDGVSERETDWREEGQAGREGDALGFAGRTVRRRVQKSVSDAFQRSTLKKDRE